MWAICNVPRGAVTASGSLNSCDLNRQQTQAVPAKCSCHSRTGDCYESYGVHHGFVCDSLPQLGAQGLTKWQCLISICIWDILVTACKNPLVCKTPICVTQHKAPAEICCTQVLHATSGQRQYKYFLLQMQGRASLEHPVNNSYINMAYPHAQILVCVMSEVPASATG